REFDAVRKESAEDVLGVGSQGVEIEGDRLVRLLATEGEQLSGEACRLLRRLHDGLGVHTSRVIRGQPCMQEVPAAGNDSQEIVEVVGHAAREQPYRLHLLSLEELGGALLDLGGETRGVG